MTTATGGLHQILCGNGDGLPCGGGGSSAGLPFVLPELPELTLAPGRKKKHARPAREVDEEDEEDGEEARDDEQIFKLIQQMQTVKAEQKKKKASKDLKAKATQSTATFKRSAVRAADAAKAAQAVKAADLRGRIEKEEAALKEELARALSLHEKYIVQAHQLNRLATQKLQQAVTVRDKKVREELAAAWRQQMDRSETHMRGAIVHMLTELEETAEEALDEPDAITENITALLAGAGGDIGALK